MRTSRRTGWSSERHGPTALVVGASHGIGAAFASELASAGSGLVLVARHADPLTELADTLREHHGVDIRTISVDAGTAAGRDALTAVIAEQEIGLLVCNAALSPIAPFVDLDDRKLDAMIDLNCRLAAHLARSAASAMAPRGRGGIVLLSSMTGDFGTAMVAHYAATKAYLRVLAEGLWAELDEYGIDVAACSPGPVATPTFLSERPRRSRGLMPATLSAQAVAHETLRRLGERPVIIPGRRNRIMAGAAGLLPIATRVRLASTRTRQMYEQ
jgi:short-subunit dehydrogenase